VLYRQRIITSRGKLEGLFTPEDIELAARSIAGNTRVFVIRPTQTSTVPAIGQTAVYVLRDNDISIIPSQYILDETKAKIIADASPPPNMILDDLLVLAPTLVVVDFDFVSLVPDTPTMRVAVENTLTAFFTDTVQFESDVKRDSYRGAIQNTQDPESGQLLESFELSAPTTDITVLEGEIASIGVVTFSI
jgi:hypothetical protein